MPQIKLVKRRESEPVYVYVYTPLSVWRYYVPNRALSWYIVCSDELYLGARLHFIDGEKDVYEEVAKRIAKIEGVVAIVVNDEEMYAVLRKKLRRSS
ncbi:MAG: hypothetical protein QXS12_05025 [Candidatus Caldarchaeum sp.]